MVVDQLNEPLIYILLGAALVSVLLGEVSDAIIIGAVVVDQRGSRSGPGEQGREIPRGAQENELAERDRAGATGKRSEIHASEVVPGDVVLVDAGRIVPCDLRWIESVNLKVEEAALTGESVPSEKDARLVIAGDNPALGDRKNMGYMSTIATYGRGVGIATATGMNTEIGKIATMLDQTEAEETPLQKKLARISARSSASSSSASAASCLRLLGYPRNHRRRAHLEHRPARVLPDGGQPRGRGDPGRTSRLRHHRARDRRPENEQAKRHRSPAPRSRDARLGQRDLLGQDRNAHPEQDDRHVLRDGKADGEDRGPRPFGAAAERTLLEGMALCTDATKSESGETGDPTEVALLVAAFKARNPTRTGLEADSAARLPSCRSSRTANS